MFEVPLVQYPESEACMLLRDNCVLAGASARLTAPSA